MKHHVLARRALYEKVWETPMSRLAKHFGLSDVGMAKICRKHDIPLPPRGYWAKKEFGKAPAQTPLPETSVDYEIELLDHGNGSVSLTAAGEHADPAATQEKSEGAKITVAETLRGAHDLVSRANQELQIAKVDADGLITQPDKPVLEVRVAKASLRRALLIMDALLKAFEERGYAVERGPKAVIRDERVHFGIVETLETEKIEPKEHDLSGPYTFAHSRFEQKRKPSGRFVLRVGEAESYWAYGLRKSWRDGKSQRVEDRLNNFVTTVINLAARHEQRREEEKIEWQKRLEKERRREEAARIRAEKLTLQKAERARVEALLQQTKDWETSRSLRAFIETAKRHVSSSEGNTAGSKEFAEWIEWASQQADRLDPFCECSPSILDEQLEEIDEPKWPYASPGYA